MYSIGDQYGGIDNMMVCPVTTKAVTVIITEENGSTTGPANHILENRIYMVAAAGLDTVFVKAGIIQQQVELFGWVQRSQHSLH